MCRHAHSCWLACPHRGCAHTHTHTFTQNACTETHTYPERHTHTRVHRHVQARTHSSSLSNNESEGCVPCLGLVRFQMIPGSWSSYRIDDTKSLLPFLGHLAGLFQTYTWHLASHPPASLPLLSHSLVPFFFLSLASVSFLLIFISYQWCTWVLFHCKASTRSWQYKPSLSYLLPCDHSVS